MRIDFMMACVVGLSTLACAGNGGTNSIDSGISLGDALRADGANSSNDGPGADSGSSPRDAAGTDGGSNSGDAAATGCTPSAPESFADDYIADHRGRMSRVACNADVALYFDDDLANLGSARTAWVFPFVVEVWKHIKDTYGSCAVPRDLPAPIGPGCERFGEEQLFAFFHEGKYHGGTIGNRFDNFTEYRNTIDVGDNGWNVDNGTLHDEIVHEACHQAEGAGQGVHESPAFGVIWGDSKWVEFCMYDFYMRSGRTAYADRVRNDFMGNRDDLPQGADGVAWFRDWFYPLWQENGSNGQVMDRFFGLLSKHFPKELENDDRNYIYTRRMNAGEYVHFTSGAAKKDLSARAAQVFKSGFDRQQFEKAQRDFPGINY